MEIYLNSSTSIKSLTIGNGTSSSILRFNYDAIANGALIITSGDFILNSSSSIIHTIPNGDTILGRVNIDVQNGNTLINGNFNLSTRGYRSRVVYGSTGYGPAGGNNATVPDIVETIGENNNVWQNISASPLLSWTSANSPSNDNYYITLDGSIPTINNYDYVTDNNYYQFNELGQGTTQIFVRSKNGAGVYSEERLFTLKFDSIPPSNPPYSSLEIISDSELLLNWENPSDIDFVKVIILRRTDTYPTGVNDGDLVYEGNGEEYLDNNLEANTRYYYTIFAADSIPNYSSGREIATTTKEKPITVSPTNTPKVSNNNNYSNEEDISISISPTITNTINPTFINTLTITPTESIGEDNNDSNINDLAKVVLISLGTTSSLYVGYLIIRKYW